MAGCRYSGGTLSSLLVELVRADGAGLQAAAELALGESAVNILIGDCGANATFFFDVADMLTLSFQESSHLPRGPARGRDPRQENKFRIPVRHSNSAWEPWGSNPRGLLHATLSRAP